QTEAMTVVSAMFDAFNRHDLDAMAALYADDAVIESPDFEAPRRGPAGIRETYAPYFEGSPDIHDEVTLMFGSGDHVAVEFVSSGTMTHLGPDDPPVMQDKAFAIQIAAMLEVRDGKIVRDVTYFDQLSLLHQLGLAD
ncbi:MAG: nuclear transport factor 2 family protein, partial [Bacteroidota bacterium]